MQFKNYGKMSYEIYCRFCFWKFYLLSERGCVRTAMIKN